MTANEILALRPRIEQFLRLFDECFVDDRRFPWPEKQSIL
jgi:hypothetical protein